MEIRDADGKLAPVRRRARTLLGVLALRAGSAMPAEHLVDTLWGERPPPSAAANLRSYIADLRRTLPPDWIESGRGGYRLAVDPRELDVLSFEALAAAGRRCLDEGEHELAVERLTRASDLWRGPVLDGDGVPDAMRPVVERLEDTRLDVIESRSQARLELGEHGPVAAELRVVAARHPLRERLWTQLMLALYRCGRQSDAVEAYQRLRRVLDDELGVEPCLPARELYLRIVRADPSLDAAPRADAPRPAAVRPPSQLPPDVSPFVGRDDHVRLLDDAADGSDAAVRITVVSGTAGVGKTALAVHWAHRVLARFPDGCLYVDLRGYGPQEPLPPAAALGGFLRGFGVIEQPCALDELAARFRTLLAGRRVLVVLDNARGVEQVRPLLPGTAGCVVVVTSRDDLGGLVVRDGARRVELGVLPSVESVRLLRRLVGSRVDAEPAAATALADRCCGLPLALRIAADLADRHADSPLADLVDELTRRGLDGLDTGDDPHTAVRVVFDWSIDALPPDVSRAFRLLATHPGRDVDVDSAAALLGIGPGETRRLVERLQRAHLVQRRGPGRHSIHDLLRAHVHDTTGEPDHDALTRLFDFYVRAARAAEAHFTLGRGGSARGDGDEPLFADAAHATRWLDAERVNLVAVVAHCARHGWAGHASELAQSLRPYLVIGSHFRDAAEIHRDALRSARAAGDRAGEAAALSNLGGVESHIGRYHEAVPLLERALRIRQHIGDRAGEARTSNNLGLTCNRLGRYRVAVGHLRRCLDIGVDLGDPALEAMALVNLGFVWHRLARYHDALACHERTLEVFRELGDRTLQGTALVNLACQHTRLGNLTAAAEAAEQALEIAVDTGEHGGEGFAHGLLGWIRTLLGELPVAHEHVERSLRIHREVGDVSAEAAVLGYQGELLRRLGRDDDALLACRRALDLNRRIGEVHQEAQSLIGLAATLRDLGRLRSAREHYEQALALARNAGHAHEEADALAGLGDVAHSSGDVAGAVAAWRVALASYVAIGTADADGVRERLRAAGEAAAVPSAVASLG